MRRKPIYYFKTLDETGISEVPADSLVIVEDGDNKEDLEIYVLDTDPAALKTLTLRKYMQNATSLYRMGGFSTKENLKKIQKNKDDIALGVIETDKLKTRMSTAEQDILNVDADILKNENNIGYNRVQIDRNTAEIATRKRETIQNKMDIGHNHTHIESNDARIKVVEDEIAAGLETKITKEISPDTNGAILDLDNFVSNGEFDFKLTYTASQPTPLLGVPNSFRVRDFRLNVIISGGMATQRIFEPSADYIWIRTQHKTGGNLVFSSWSRFSSSPDVIEIASPSSSFPITNPPKKSELEAIHHAFRNIDGNDEFTIVQHGPGTSAAQKTILQVIKCMVIDGYDLFYQVYKH